MPAVAAVSNLRLQRHPEKKRNPEGLRGIRPRCGDEEETLLIGRLLTSFTITMDAIISHILLQCKKFAPKHEFGHAAHQPSEMHPDT